MPTLIEQLLLDDPSQIIERGNFFEISSEGIIMPEVTDEENVNTGVFRELSEKLSDQLFDKKLLNTSIRKVDYINITLSDEFKNRKEELVIDSFYYQINFNVDFTLNYFENISKIYLTFYPSLTSRGFDHTLYIGVTGYICYELIDRSCHQEKLSFKPRTTIRVKDFFNRLFLYNRRQIPIQITDIFKYNDDYNSIFSLFKEEIAEKLALLISVD